MTIETSALGTVSALLAESVGFYWDTDGKFLQVGKFKAKRASAESFIEKLKESALVVRNSGEPWERFRELLGDEFRAIGSPDNFPRFILESYIREFPFPFKITQGKGIHDVFTRFRPGSCMRHDDCHAFREFYVKNRESVGTIHWEVGSHELLVSDGSQLLWFDTTPEIRGIQEITPKIYNRILKDKMYSSGFLPFVNVLLPQFVNELLRNWYPQFPEIVDLRNTGEKIVLRGLNFHDDLFPWMDSLYYGKLHTDGTISLSNYDRKGTVELQNCNGTDIESDSGKVHCCSCRERFEEDYMYSPESGDGLYCEVCYSEFFGYSDYDDSEYPREEIRCVVLLDRRGRERDITISQSTLDSEFRKYTGDYWDSVEYIHYELAIETNSGEFVSAEDCAQGYSDSKLEDIQDSELVIPWGCDIAIPFSDCHLWQSGERGIPVGSPVPRGFYPRNTGERGALPGQFVKKFGEFLVVLFDSTGDTSQPYSVGIRNPNNSGIVSIPRNFRFHDETSAVYALRLLSAKLGTDTEKRDCAFNWDGSGTNSPDFAWLAQIVESVSRELAGL